MRQVAPRRLRCSRGSRRSKRTRARPTPGWSWCDDFACRPARPSGDSGDLPPFDISAQANAYFGPDAIKLDANENPYAPLVGGALAADVNRYPEPQPERSRLAMAHSTASRATIS